MIISAGICQPTVIAVSPTIPQQNGADLSLVSNGPCRAVRVSKPQFPAPTTWYVRKTGSDLNDGKTPATAFQTIGKLTSSFLAHAGDTIWVGAGIYREAQSLGVTGNSDQPISLCGDVDGSNTGDAGEVVITAYTPTDYDSGTGQVLGTSSQSWWTFRNLTLHGAGTCFSLAQPTGRGFTLYRCTLSSLGGVNTAIAVGNGLTYRGPLDFTLDSCIVVAANGIMPLNFPANGASDGITANSGPDINLNITISNSLLITTGTVVSYGSDTGNVRLRGGNSIIGCTILTGNVCVFQSEGSVGIPNRVYNCLIIGIEATSLQNQGTSGALIEDFNHFQSQTPRSGVPAGAHSLLRPGDRLELGQSMLRGAQPRPFFEPAAGASIMSVGSNVATSAVAQLPATDLFGRFRPTTSSVQGPASSSVGAITGTVGYLERANNWGKETVTVFTGTNAISVLGAGPQDFELAVDARTTTISIYLQYDASYVGTLPTLQVLNGAEAGVQPITVSMSVSAGVWQQLSIAFTPSRQGIVTVRVASYDSSMLGHAYADTFTVQ